MDGSKESVIQRLEAYLKRFDDLLAMLQGTLPLRGEAKAEAQAVYKALKTDLGEEYKRMSTSRSREALTETEQAYYQPVIHQTFVELYSPTNATPDGKLYGHLYGARINITHMLDQMKSA